jgi:hypothetical protein
MRGHFTAVFSQRLPFFSQRAVEFWLSKFGSGALWFNVRAVVFRVSYNLVILFETDWCSRLGLVGAQAWIPT